MILNQQQQQQQQNTSTRKKEFVIKQPEDETKIMISSEDSSCGSSNSSYCGSNKSNNTDSAISCTTTTTTTSSSSSLKNDCNIRVSFSMSSSESLETSSASDEVYDDAASYSSTSCSIIDNNIDDINEKHPTTTTTTTTISSDNYADKKQDQIDCCSKLKANHQQATFFEHQTTELEVNNKIEEEKQIIRNSQINQHLINITSNNNDNNCQQSQPTKSTTTATTRNHSNQINKSYNKYLHNNNYNKYQQHTNTSESIFKAQQQQQQQHHHHQQQFYYQNQHNAATIAFSPGTTIYATPTDTSTYQSTGAYYNNIIPPNYSSHSFQPVLSGALNQILPVLSYHHPLDVAYNNATIESRIATASEYNLYGSTNTPLGINLNHFDGYNTIQNPYNPIIYYIPQQQQQYSQNERIDQKEAEEATSFGLECSSSPSCGNNEKVLIVDDDISSLKKENNSIEEKEKIEEDKKNVTSSQDRELTLAEQKKSILEVAQDKTSSSSSSSSYIETPNSTTDCCYENDGIDDNRKNEDKNSQQLIGYKQSNNNQQQQQFLNSYGNTIENQDQQYYGTTNYKTQLLNNQNDLNCYQYFKKQNNYNPYTNSISANQQCFLPTVYNPLNSQQLTNSINDIQNRPQIIFLPATTAQPTPLNSSYIAQNHQLNVLNQSQQITARHLMAQASALPIPIQYYNYPETNNLNLNHQTGTSNPYLNNIFYSQLARPTIQTQHHNTQFLHHHHHQDNNNQHQFPAYYITTTAATPTPFKNSQQQTNYLIPDYHQPIQTILCNNQLFQQQQQQLANFDSQQNQRSMLINFTINNNNLLSIIPIEAEPTKTRQAYGMDKVWLDEFEQLFSQFVSMPTSATTVANIVWNLAEVESNPIIRDSKCIVGYRGRYIINRNLVDNQDDIDEKDEIIINQNNSPEIEREEKIGDNKEEEVEEEEEQEDCYNSSNKSSCYDDNDTDIENQLVNDNRKVETLTMTEESKLSELNSSKNCHEKSFNTSVEELEHSTDKTDQDSGVIAIDTSSSSSSLTSSFSSSTSTEETAATTTTNSNILNETEVETNSDSDSKTEDEDGDGEGGEGEEEGKSLNFKETVMVNQRRHPTKFRMFIDSAKVRFCCDNCGHGWTSMKGRVVFWYELFELISLGNEIDNYHYEIDDNYANSINESQLIGYCAYKLFGQRCDICKIENRFERPMWYPEEVTKVLNNLYNKIGQIYFGFKMPAIDKQRRAGKPKTSHNSSLCQACHDGVCTDRK